MIKTKSIDKALQLCSKQVEFPTYSEALAFANGNSDLVKETNNKFFVNITQNQNPSLFKYKYKVRERIANKTRPVQQFLKFETTASEVMKAKKQINEWLKKKNKNWEAYDVQKL